MITFLKFLYLPVIVIYFLTCTSFKASKQDNNIGAVINLILYMGKLQLRDFSLHSWKDETANRWQSEYMHPFLTELTIVSSNYTMWYNWCGKILVGPQTKSDSTMNNMSRLILMGSDVKWRSPSEGKIEAKQRGHNPGFWEVGFVSPTKHINNVEWREVNDLDTDSRLH